MDCVRIDVEVVGVVVDNPAGTCYLLRMSVAIGAKLRIRKTHVSLVFDDGDTYIFDLSGRPVSIFQRSQTFLRGLDGTIKQKSWDGASDALDRQILTVTGPEKDLLLDGVANRLRSLPVWSPDWTEPGMEDAVVSVAAHFQVLDRPVWEKDETAFRSIYTQIPILPPDQYFTIVLQVADGCPWNRCTFCDFYRDQPYRTRSLNEIVSHMKQVKEFLGPGVSLRRSVFLGDANALSLPSPLLLNILKQVREFFPEQVEFLDGIHSFGDVPAILKKDPSHIRAFAEAGLRRVYIGLETAADPLRTLINKRGGASDVYKAVTKLTENGIRVGLIILLGVGGAEYAESHVESTGALLRSLPLTQKDIVFFSPFYPAEDSEYVRHEATRSLTRLERPQLRNQYLQLRDKLRSLNPSPMQGIYNIEEFLV